MSFEMRLSRVADSTVVSLRGPAMCGKTTLIKNLHDSGLVASIEQSRLGSPYVGPEPIEYCAFQHSPTEVKERVEQLGYRLKPIDEQPKAWTITPPEVA